MCGIGARSIKLAIAKETARLGTVRHGAKIDVSHRGTEYPYPSPAQRDGDMIAQRFSAG